MGKGGDLVTQIKGHLLKKFGEDAEDIIHNQLS
jgi:hypothetical protein